MSAMPKQDARIFLNHWLNLDRGTELEAARLWRDANRLREDPLRDVLPPNIMLHDFADAVASAIMPPREVRE
jgi:hypothetical protein